MRFLFPFIFLSILCLSFRAQSHPEDELIIREIEEGQLEVQDQQVSAEYAAALKRQRIRKLSAMPWYEKFFVFVKAGIEHIIPKGLDHILFVLGLFFSSLILGSLLWQVSAFTLAHTITLAVAALGIVQAPAGIVEPLIALSIVWVAAENCIFKEASKWRPFVVFSFGLLHGLGFASVLSEYGLPQGNLVPSLLAFNIGVEVGQLIVLVVAALLVWFIRDKSWYRKRVQIPASIMIALVGLFWFVERVFL
ncbi:HupE/UreJ family protein [Reichenbachiella versicolor]|uniref:HupE/UreJ family protein n=1 Tax=Reichenbachiella versicolor TaxID=1821036 RepID=UPI001C88E079|nr:HupE/UreJ family protein [Reichenbachiella versicolor]